jgi:hypothetical protein
VVECICDSKGSILENIGGLFRGYKNGEIDEEMCSFDEFYTEEKNNQWKCLGCGKIYMSEEEIKKCCNEEEE